jgi:hypothetical protein
VDGKRSCSHKEKGQEPRGLTHLKKQGKDDEEGDNDYCSYLLHTRKDKREQDHGGEALKNKSIT